MIIIIDFDDTLLNTKDIYEKLASEELSKFGITHDQFIDTKEKMQKKFGGPLRFYDIDRHSEIMGENNSVSTEDVKEAILNFFRTKISDLVFNDVHDFLKLHKSDKLILMTFGDKLIQKSKVEGSGLSKYFDSIIFTEQEPKSEVIKRLISEFSDNEKIVFIDDKAEELKRTREICPNVVCIRIKRKEGRYTKEKTPKGCYDVKSLEKVGEIIKNL